MVLKMRKDLPTITIVIKTYNGYHNSHQCAK